MADGYDTTLGKSPAFQFYAKDFDSGTRAFSAEEVGAYIRFLCHQWDKGSIPSDLESLARIAGVSLVRMRRVWLRLQDYFIIDPDNESRTRLLNVRLERERLKQALYRQKQSDKGKASAANRRATDSQPESNRGSTEPQPEGQPKLNSSISDLQSSDFSQERTHPRAREVSPSEAPELSERAARFLERYDALHREYRRGAPYMGKPHIDHHEAMQLVRVYDDARLDKLATVWLNADDAFAENGTRTIAKFRSRASWCDERLRERGL
jgi:uncharacterized protein YdaU (DUF1376 family)